MEQTRVLGKPTRSEMAAALALYAATISVSLGILAQQPVTQESLLVGSGVTAAGTVAIAFLLRNRTVYPRRAFMIAAGILAASALIGPWLAGTPAEAAEGARSILWMHPWFPMVFAWTSGPRTGVCAPTSPWAGPLLIGTAVVLSVITWGAVALSGLL